jgi:hypothetical protein
MDIDVAWNSNAFERRAGFREGNEWFRGAMLGSIR